MLVSKRYTIAEAKDTKTEQWQAQGQNIYTYHVAEFPMGGHFWSVVVVECGDPEVGYTEDNQDCTAFAVSDSLAKVKPKMVIKETL